MAGQAAYHLLAQAGQARAPWAITTIVSCLPVLVLAMGTALAHMLRTDAASADMKDSRTSGPADPWSPEQPAGDQAGPDQGQDQGQDHGPASRSGPPAGTGQSPQQRPAASGRTTAPENQNARPQKDQARLIARKLAAAGKPVSRRALRAAGAKGSNESLNALARKVNAELADGSTISLPQAAKTGHRLLPLPGSIKLSDDCA